MTTQQLGQAAETFACQYLQTQGLILVARNVHTRFSEIDLIMETNDQLVFIEVRYRHYAHFGHPAETVTLAKQRKLIRGMQYYLHCHPTYQKTDFRFDVVAMSGSLKKPKIEWIQNAFSIDDF